MTYLSVYEAVYDQCDVERNWEGHAHIGDQKLLNVAEIEASGSDEEVTIYTSDESLGNLNPEAFGLNVQMEYISYAKEE